MSSGHPWQWITDAELSCGREIREGKDLNTRHQAAWVRWVTQGPEFLPDHEAASRHPRHPRPWLVSADGCWLVIGWRISTASSQLTRGPVWHWHGLALSWARAGMKVTWCSPVELCTLTSGAWWPSWGGLVTLWVSLTSEMILDGAISLLSVVKTWCQNAFPRYEGGGIVLGLPWCHSDTGGVQGWGVDRVWSCGNLSLSVKACLNSHTSQIWWPIL